MGNFDRRKLMDSILKMDTTTWLSLILAIITLATPALSSEPRVVCYYTNWSVYRPGTARFNPQNINPYLCTHLVYAFGGFTKDNTLKPFDKYQDIEKGGYAKFTGLKTYNKKLKTLLAIGGWNEGSTRFSPMVAARDRRKEFVRNAIKFLRQNHFDGLDLDWEYPAFRDGGKPKDRENYAKLVKELREEFEREAEKTGKPRLLLTMAVPAGIEYIQKGFDVKTLNQYLDWMNLLTYDYHSAFEPAVNHHAPLYPLEEPNEYSVDNELNIDYTIKFYLEQGADRDKLVLGIPTYGRSYTLFNPDAVEIGAPADGPGEQGDATREKGYLAYYEICEALKPKARKKKSADEDSEEESEEEEEDQPWTVVHPNPNAMGPVAYKGNQWVGYDDIDIVRKKAQYVAENGLGGIMFWSIDNDDFRGTCHGKPYPLIEAAKESYLLGLGSDNVIVTEKPRSLSTPRSTSNRRRNRPKNSSTTTAKPTTAASNKRKSGQSVVSTTPAWSINTPEPPTTPDPGSDFKCTDEGFFPHPRDCKKYFWCLDSGPSNLGIVAHQFTCPSGLFFNKAADSCDFARNVLCKKPTTTTKAPTTKPASTTSTTSTTTRRPVKLSTKNSLLFRTTTTTTTPEPEEEEEYSEEVVDDTADIDAEDPKVIKELIDLIKKVGGVEQLEKQLHLSESSTRNEGAITTTPLPISKKLYQKVLERTRGKLPAKTSQGSPQNSRRGPQNAGLEPSDDRDKLIKKERPQYTTINRARSSTRPPLEEALEDEVDDAPQQLPRARAVSEEPRVATTAKPLQYVNIRRARPTSDTADDTASRNALFERQEPYVSVSENANTLDISSARRENIPEYVTIRRQRPTTEEATTVQYSESEGESQETALEREISSPVSEFQPKYTSILRARPSTYPPEDPSTPEPTTVLAVQISSLLNSPAEEGEDEVPETTVADVTEAVTTTTTTTTTSAPSIATSRRPIRRRGSTTTTQAPAVSSTTQVSSRNYTFVRRRRPLPQKNEISTDSEDTETTRRIRSTTPDSREIEPNENNNSLNREREAGYRRSRFRFQIPIEDSVPAAASPVSRGQFRPQLTRDEVLSLTPLDDDKPHFVPKQSFSPRNEIRFQSRTTAPNRVADSEASAATVEDRPSSFIPRGRRKFTLSSTTPSLEETVESEVTLSPKRPAFARLTPRPFTRTSTATTAAVQQEDLQETVVTSRLPTRLPFGRTRLISSTIPPQTQPLKFAFPSRLSTTPQSLADEIEEEELEEKTDDISLSESAIAEKEHDEDSVEDVEDVQEPPKRRIVIKKLRPPSSTTESTISTEAVQISEENGKKKFRVIRRRPTSTTSSSETSSVSTETPVSSTPTRIRKIIRKKIKPVEDEPEIIAKSIGSLNSAKDVTTEIVANYGEKNRPTTTTTTTSEAPLKVEKNTEKVDIPQLLEDVPVRSEENEADKDEEKVQPLPENDKENDTTEATDNETNQKPEVVIETQQKDVDISEQKETPLEEASEEPQPETSTTSTTQLTSPSSRGRVPYRPPKRIFTSTTESTPSSSRTFSRKFNPGVYTSPSTIEKTSEVSPSRSVVTRRPFSARTFTRRPFTTARTTKKIEEEEEEYSEEEDFDEPEEESPLVFVPPSQLFTRKRPGEEEDNAPEDSQEEDDSENQPPNRFVPSSRRPTFKPRVVNSNTFRTTSSTTELPKRPISSLNRTAILNRFGANRPINDTKKRVQNVPVGYSSSKPSTEKEISEIVTEKGSEEEVGTTNTSTDGIETTTEDDDYLTMTETTSSATTSTDNDSTTELGETELTTDQFDFDADDYLEFTEGTTNLPSTQEFTSNTQAETETQAANTERITPTATLNKEVTTEVTPETTPAPTPTPIVKTQYNKLFSVSRVVEVNSKLDKHRLNKKNETTLIEEGEIMVEKKPTVHKIGEVSRFSLIKIFEDEIPIYLTKLGHVYPVENPPDNLIRIDEARNARALVNFSDAPRENLIASESMNEAYRHVNKVTGEQLKDTPVSKDQVVHIPNDDFLRYINDEKKSEKSEEEQYASWQFVPAAYENERNRAAKMFEIITPRSMLTEPSTLPLEALFKTENPMARKVAETGNQPFVVYSASLPTQKEDANIVKLDVLKPESGRSIITFAKGQEFHGAPVAETTIKYPVNISVLPKTSQPVTITTSTDTVTTSPIVELLTTKTTVSVNPTTETQTTVASTTEVYTTETISEETTTVKSPIDTKRSKFAFPRRPAIKPNVPRPSVTTRPAKIANATVSGNLFTKSNKTSTLNLSKPRFTGNRSQNVPVDARKKITSKPPKTFTTTQSPKTTTDKIPYYKSIRTGSRPAFFPRRTTTPATTQAIKRPNFLRRTKSPQPAASEGPVQDTVEVTTSKYTRRTGNRFKSRKNGVNSEKRVENSEKRDENSEMKLGNPEKRVEISETQRPSLNGAGARGERPRNFARRRPAAGGANVSTTTSQSSSSPQSSSPSPSAAVSRRPFRVASRRRPIGSTVASTTKTTTTTTEEPLPSTTAATTMFIDEDMDDTSAEVLEEPEPSSTNRNKTQVTRRPLLLKEESQDQNPSATNEDERKRHSKKYSASIKQNQLDEVLKRAKSKEEYDITTEGMTKTTIDDYSAETALAIATHQLLSAPPPSHHDYDERPSKKSTTDYRNTGFTEKYSRTPYNEFSSTPIYKTTTNQEYDTTFSTDLNTPRTSSPTTYKIKSSTFSTLNNPTSTYSSPFTAKVSRPAAFSAPEIITLSQGPSTLSSFSSTVTPRFSSSFPVPESVPSTSRYLPTPKLIPVPVEDYTYSTGGYSDVREPAYFTREYLLESPVTKTYDDEYQYLSPVTTPQTTTRKIPKKVIHKKISTTLRPTLAAYVPPVTTPKPRRVPARKPFEKVSFEKVQKPTKTYFKPVDYDYYEDGDEKIAEKYAEGTKVVLHAKGNIECLDIGNFPHPTSCKKFISCARLENGSLLGWEYICPKGLSFDPVGGICNWSAGLGCDEKDI